MIFKTLQKALYEIKNILLNSEDLRKVMFYSDFDPLSKSTPTIDEVKDLFLVKPVIFVNETSVEYNTNTLISIGVVEGEKLTKSGATSIKILAVADRKIWEVADNGLRPFMMAEEIENLLDKTKLSAAGKLYFRVFREVYFNENLVGLALLFDLDTEDGSVDEF